jgi:hypothetical protein
MPPKLGAPHESNKVNNTTRAEPHARDDPSFSTLTHTTCAEGTRRTDFEPDLPATMAEGDFRELVQCGNSAATHTGTEPGTLIRSAHTKYAVLVTR